MKREKAPKESLETKNRIANILDIPASVISGVFRLELSANREAVLTECESIKEYTDGSITLRASQMLINFTGENIRIRSMNMGTVTIEGHIHSINFTDFKP